MIERLRLHVEHTRRGLDIRPMQAAFKSQRFEIEIQKVPLRLAAQGKRLPLLDNDDATANRQYTRHFALSRDRVRGKAHGLRCAEYYHCVGRDESPVEDYVSKNAVPL